MTDHGHYLGEHDCWGKPPAPVYATLGQIPLIVCAPGRCARDHVDALTTNVDVCETLLDLFGVTRTRQRPHGRSLLPLLRGETTSVRDFLLQGYWGQRVQRDRPRAQVLAWRPEAAMPLSIYSNRWSTMPPIELPDPDDRATLGPYMPGSKMPVIRQPLALPEVERLLWSVGAHASDLLFEPNEDPDELVNQADHAPRVRRATELLLRSARRGRGAP